MKGNSAKENKSRHVIEWRKSVQGEDTEQSVGVRGRMETRVSNREWVGKFLSSGRSE